MSTPDTNSPHEMNDDPDSTQVMTTYADSDNEYEDYQDFDDDGGLPGRPRRVLVTRWTALLAAVVIGGACFYGGVRVEKSKVGTSSTATAGGGFAALASRAGGFSRRTGAAASTAKGTSTAAAAGGAAGGFGGAAGGFGAGAAGGGGTSGTISSISGDTLYIAETGGTTVKVNLSDTTTLKKTESISKQKLYPGDTISVTGATGSNGAITATAVTDSGSSASTTGTSGATGSTSSSTSGTSALNSLFGG